MTFRVQIETPAGVAIGGGPLTSVTSVSIQTSMDRAGNLSLTMPATDPDTVLFPDDTEPYVRIREFRNGTWITAGRGIIKQKSLNSETRMLQLSGPDLLDELTRTHVGTLSLTDNPSVPEDPMAAASILPAIMAYALAGWTSTGTPSADVYYQFGDETVLAALIKIAEILGDHFRLSATVDRQVEWLPTTAAGFDAAASGVRAGDVGDPEDLLDNPDLCILAGGLEVSTDDTERITRIYPRGGGNAGARLYLNGTTWTAPAGYTLHIDADPAQSYIAHTVNDAAGQIGVTETIRDIAPLNDSSAAAIAASNQLAVAAHKILQRRIHAQKAYRMRVTKLHKNLLVADTIYVKSKHVTDDYKWIDEGREVMVTDKRSTYERGEAGHDLDVTL